jgi:transposase, IS6 family
MLLVAASVSGLFKWRQFEPEVILLAVGWYLRFSLSYRDVEELLAERGLLVDHVTVWRCSVTPRKWNDVCARDSNRPPTVGGWTLTYIRVKGKWRYLYRAVDSSGATLDFLLWSQAGRG